MLAYFNGVKNKYVVICDLEFDHMDIVQSAGLIFEQTDITNVYKLKKSFDYLIIQKVSRFFTDYTGITQEQINEEGISLDSFKNKMNIIMSELDLQDTLFVSHGTRGDRAVFRVNGMGNILPHHSFCTYKSAMRLLPDNEKYSLESLAANFGLKLKGHTAMNDALMTFHLFTIFKNQENNLERSE